MVKLRNTVAQNECKVKDSFEAVNRIELLKLLELFELIELFDQVYRYFLFHLMSLFKSAPLIKIIHITIDRVYKDSLIDKKFIKITMNK